ncbi:MAG: 7-cyano-7-deazaguanine synthase QueC [Deltaproteobacteria bacterium]|nr:7-cyano-7-deazaguanine synthase QueC [Deltaproteobacteria bacterium]
MRSSSIVLLSGGLDSLASLHWARGESDLVMAVTFNYGQRSAEKEIDSAKKICRHYDVHHQVLDLPWFASMKASALIDTQETLPELRPEDLDKKGVTEKSAKAVWVPNRNGVFINAAASLAENQMVNWIVAGFNKEEARTFPDNSEEFVEAANRFLKFSTNGAVMLKAPMMAKTKKEIVLWALGEKVDFSPLWSCYRGGEKMCGVCESCARCRRALKQAGAADWLERLF